MPALKSSLRLLGLAAAIVPAFASTTVPAGTISVNTNWTLAGSPYLVQGDVTVQGTGNPRLTIDPGVELRFSAGASLRIAADNWDNNDWRGQLTAVGTLAQPITFTAANGNSGGWSGLVFGYNADTGGATSQLQHCIIEKATRNLALHQTSQPALLADLEVRNASDEGLYLLGSASVPTLQDLSIHDNADYAILVSGAPLPAQSGLSLTANGENRLAYTGIITADLSLDLVAYPLPVVFVSQTQVYGAANPRLTLTAGSELRFKAGASLRIALDNWDNNDWRGQLTAVGTAGQPIVFTADNGASGGWNGLIFGYNSDTGGATSQLQHCIIEKATRNLALHQTSQPALLADLELRSASDEGLYLLGSASVPTLQDLSIHDNADYAVLLSGTPLPSQSGLSLTANGENRLAYTGTITADLSLDLVAYPLPVVFVGQIQVYGAANPRLTLTAGSELRFKAGASLRIAIDNWDSNDWRGQLTAVGTAGQPIVFTADNGNFGGWNGLIFGVNSDTGGATSQLQHCIIEKATRNLALHQTSQPAPLADVELRNASDEGLYIFGSSNLPSLQDLSIHDNADYGILLDGTPLPTQSGLSLTANGENRLAYTGIITSDMTLDLVAYPLPVVFVGQTQVYGTANPRLTLTAGSELRFKAGASLRIAVDNWDSNDWRGQLTAVGTAGQPIVFTADNGNSGGWNGLIFGFNSDFGGATSQLQHCLIEKATRNLALHQTSQPAPLADVELRNASDEGLYLFGSSSLPTLQDLNIHDNADYAVLLSGTPLPSQSGLSLTANGENRLAYTGIVTSDLTLDLAAYPLPVVFVGQTQVYGAANPRLTLTAGSELRFKAGASLRIAIDNWDSSDWRGQLTAVGTAGQPIVFTADNNLSGGWGGLVFGYNSDMGGATSQLQHCLIEKATRNLALHQTSQPVPLADVELRGASDEGLYIFGSSSLPTLQDLSIHDNADYAVLLSGTPLPGQSGLNLTANGENRLAYTGIVSADLTLDLAAYPLPVVFVGQTQVYGAANPRLTLTAGSELRFKAGASLRIALDNWDSNDWRGQLTAVGTALQPVVFTADNNLPGGWNGLVFGYNADTGGAWSRLEHCALQRATTNLSLLSTSQPDTLLHLELREATTYGLLLSSSYPLTANCRLLDNATAIRLENSGATVIGDSPALANSFMGNENWNLYNNGAGAVAARYNGWCVPESATPATYIYDQVDNAAKGLVTYLPVAAVDLMRIVITYNSVNDSFHFEWCPVLGAGQYRIYGSPTNSWPTPLNATLLATTTDSWVELPRTSLPASQFFYGTADVDASMAREGACR